MVGAFPHLPQMGTFSSPSRKRLDDFINRSNATDAAIRTLNEQAEREARALDSALDDFINKVE